MGLRSRSGRGSPGAEAYYKYMYIIRVKKLTILCCVAISLLSGGIFLQCIYRHLETLRFIVGWTPVSLPSCPLSPVFWWNFVEFFFEKLYEHYQTVIKVVSKHCSRLKNARDIQICSFFLHLATVADSKGRWWGGRPHWSQNFFSKSLFCGLKRV